MTDRHVTYGKKIARAIFMMSGDPSLIQVREERLAKLIDQVFRDGQESSNVIELAEIARRSGA
jgi:hypothetical protein